MASRDLAITEPDLARRAGADEHARGHRLVEPERAALLGALRDGEHEGQLGVEVLAFERVTLLHHCREEIALAVPHRAGA